MAGPKSTKRDIERAKRARAAAKRDRREQRGDEPADEGARGSSGFSEGQLLEQLRVLHERFEAKAIDFETFEAQRDELIALLSGGS